MYKLRKKNFIALLIVIFLAGSLLTAGGLYVYMSVSGTKLVDAKEDAAMRKFASDYTLLFQVDQYINSNFLWDKDLEKTREKITEEVVNALGDPYSEYMDKESFNAFNKYLSGKFDGVGITYTQIEDDFVITSTVKDSPAEAAGLKERDIIKKVDGKTYKTMEKVQAALRGPKGTKVSVEYERDGKLLKCTLVRDEINVQAVTSMVLEKNIGYIGISGFERETGERFATELKELENKNVKGLVIDLRYNGGGYLTEGLEVADALLPACTLTKTVDKTGKMETFESKSSCTDLPYVILVNGGTASASEVLAGAIQDNHGGKIVGTKTFGKGIVQSTFPLTNGGSLKLTTMEYLTPDNHKVHKKGITPDYVVEADVYGLRDYQLEKAIKLLK